MKNFLLKVGLFVLMLCMLIYGLVLNIDGYTDAYYLKLTSSAKQNLILGTSRAAQGLMPSELEKGVGKDFYNFAFTLGHSPFGPTYLNTIRQKLDTKSTSQLFIVTVDPWSISDNSGTPNDSVNFKEGSRFLGQISNVNLNPNLEYVYKYIKPRYKLLFDKYKFSFLHKNGWLEIDVPMDSTSMLKRKREKLKTYKNEYVKQFLISEIRIKYLEKTIRFLKNYGEVILVRLPISEEMLAIESKFAPNFTKQIEGSIAISAEYIDLSNKGVDYQFTDGNHLYRESCKKLSKNLGFEIAGLIQK